MKLSPLEQYQELGLSPGKQIMFDLVDLNRFDRVGRCLRVPISGIVLSPSSTHGLIHVKTSDTEEEVWIRLDDIIVEVSEP